MNKTQLIEIVASKANLKKKDAELVVNTVFESVTEALGAGEKVQLFGFGSFDVKQRAARVGRNPRTKKAMKIPAYKVATFSPARALKDTVNK